MTEPPEKPKPDVPKPDVPKPDVPKPDVNAVRDHVNGLMRLHGIKQAVVAREAGVTPSALSRFLGGSYEGDNDALALKLLAWSENRSKRDGMPSGLTRALGFVSTSVSKRIVTALEFAQVTGDLVVIVGEPGVGKTKTLGNFQQRGSSVWMATMSSDASGPVPALQELGAVFGLDLTGGAAGMRRRIVNRVRDTGGLVIVDEAQHLDAKAIEAFRGIHDATGIGMVLCGNSRITTKVGQLPQVNSRVGRKIILRKVSRRDVVAVAGQFDIAGREELDFLHTISQFPGGLRCVVKDIRLAMFAADGEGVPVNAGHLVAAWSELALEEQV